MRCNGKGVESGAFGSQSGCDPCFISPGATLGRGERTPGPPAGSTSPPAPGPATLRRSHGRPESAGPPAGQSLTVVGLPALYAGREKSGPVVGKNGPAGTTDD